MKAVIQCEVKDLVLLREKTCACGINNLFAEYNLVIICMCESQSVFFIYTEGECSSIEKIKASLELDAEKILTEENFTLKVIENVSLGKIVNLDLNNY